MAVLALQTTEAASVDTSVGGRLYNTQKWGTLRLLYFTLAAVAVAGDATSTVDLCKLPPGKLRILPKLSWLKSTAFGAGRTLSVGFAAYNDSAGAAVAADPTALLSALDVSAAINASNLGAPVANTAQKYDVYSQGGILIRARVNVDTIPVNTTLEGYIAFVMSGA